MPITLSVDHMRDWFFVHGRITECSLTFSRLDPEDAPNKAKPLRKDSMWVEIYQRYLDEIVRRKFSSSEFRVVVPVEGKPRVMLACFDGVVENDRLIRIWGLARDVTELTELNSRLLRDQDRLRSYARALTSAEERARRATAVDLHDGICQSLAGMSMKIEAAKQHAPATTKPLLDELKQQLHDVQEQTRDVISGLSPPGLYDLGLTPALNWLAVYYRGQEKLNVQVDCRVDEARISLDLRVLVFKLVRELLRNVTKHAKVGAAKLFVDGRSDRLVVRVEDAGCGFQWNPDVSPTGKFGFGLWSIAERVAEVGGDLRVDSALGDGARLELNFPLLVSSTESRTT